MNLIKPMKTIATTSALCAVIALSSISSVNAASGGNTFDSPRYHQRGGDFGAKMQKRMIKKLDLSAEQQVQIDALKAQAKEQNQILRESMKKFKTEEKALLAIHKIKQAIVDFAFPFFESMSNRQKLIDFIYPSMLTEDYKIVAENILSWKGE